MLIDHTTTVVRSPTCLGAAMGEEMILMSSLGDRYFGLDSIGADVWSRIAAPCRVGDLCAALSAEYDAAADVIQADVVDLLTKLAELGAIEVRQEGS